MGARLEHESRGCASCRVRIVTEKLSRWKKRPPVGDSITVVIRATPRQCAKVTVRRKNSRTYRMLGLLYSTTQYEDGSLGGVVGVVRVEDRGTTWAWGWTTEEACALRVACAL